MRPQPLQPADMKEAPKGASMRWAQLPIFIFMRSCNMQQLILLVNTQFMLRIHMAKIHQRQH